MIPEYGEKIYLILSKILGFNFKSQIRGSGIELKELYKMTNLVNQSEGFLLVVGDKSIFFKNNDEFVIKFCKYIKGNLDQFNEDYRKLRNHEQNDMVVDKYDVFYQDEYIGHCSSKQLKLLEKLRELHSKNSNITKDQVL